MPRMPLMEYDEPAESVLTEDTCVTEPVDTAQRKRGSQSQQEVEGQRAPVPACHKGLGATAGEQEFQAEDIRPTVPPHRLWLFCPGSLLRRS